jgi:tetratricopeptide (TPR) repeat protein
LAQDGENFHALSNLVRYQFLTAQFAQAETHARRLGQIESDHPDFPLKKAEAFAFLGDDEQVWAAYQEAKRSGEELAPFLLHLAATAAYRQGKERAAWGLWRKAVKNMPSLAIAQDCLAERLLPVGERHLPWYWSFPYWFPFDMDQLLQDRFGWDVENLDEEYFAREMNALLDEYPYLPKLFPHLLERGDRAAREFVVNLIRVVDAPELMDVLYAFAQGRYGSDELRMEAMQFINQYHGDMLPADRSVSMWVEGKPTELLLIGFEITDEPEPVAGIPVEILDQFADAYDLILEDETAEAEQLLKEIIAAAPEFYSAYNHLGMVYERQGRFQEAHQLVEETHARFPDYLFSRVAMARILIKKDDVEEARALVEPILRRSKLHYSEFRALAQVQMDLALADKQPETARTWLGFWEQVDPDDPDLAMWKLRIDGPGDLLDGLQKLLKRGR